MADGDRQATIARLRRLVDLAGRKGRSDIQERHMAHLSALENAADYEIPESKFPVGGAQRRPGDPGYQEPREDTIGDYARAFVSGAGDVATLGDSAPEKQLQRAEQYDRDVRDAGTPEERAKLRGVDTPDGRAKSDAARDAMIRTLTHGTIRPSLEGAQNQAYAVSRHPVTALLGGIAAAPFALGTKVAGGLARMLPGAAERVLPAAVTRAVPVASNAGKTIITGLAAGGGGSAETTARAIAAGEPVTDALKQGAEAFVPSALLGAGIHRLNLSLSDLRTLTGQYVRGMKFGKESGYFDSPEYRGPGEFDDPAKVPPGYSKGLGGVGEATRDQGGRIAVHNAARYKQMNADWKAGSKHRGRTLDTDVSQFVGDIRKSVERFSNKRPVDKTTAAVAEDAVANLSREVPTYEADLSPQPVRNPDARPASPIERRAIEGPGAVDEVGPAENTLPRRRREGMFARDERKLLTAAKEERALMATPKPDAPVEVDSGTAAAPAADGEPSETLTMRETGSEMRPIATLRDLIKQKQAWKKLAQHGQVATAENMPYRTMFRAAVKATKRMAKSHPDPDVQAAAKKQVIADRKFLADAKDLEDVNARLFGKKKANLSDSVASQRRAGNELLQVIKDTQAGGTRRADMDALRAKGGIYEDAVNKAGAKMSDEASRWTLKPGTFGHTGSWGGGVTGALSQLAEATKVRLMEPMTRPRVAVQVGAQAGRLSGHRLNRDTLDAILERIGLRDAR